jgi:tetratricopeptide (TPR) repeat protein
MLRLTLFSISSFLCLNLGFAQTSVPTPTPSAPPSSAPATSQPSYRGGTLAPNPSSSANSSSSSSNPTSPAFPPITITTTPPSGSGDGSSGTPTDSLLNLVGSVNAGKGKYEEYQSVCRENLFDVPAYLDETVQQQRIDELKEKIKTSKTPMTFKLKLLKEYIDQGKKLEAEQQYASVKAEKTNEEASKIAEALMAWFRQEVNRAESTLAKVVIDNPKNAEALGYLAEIYTANQKYFEAASAYFDLGKLTKENYDLQLCEIHTLDSQHKEAEKFCKKANQALPKNPYPFIYLGISEREKLNLDQAVANFKDSLRRQQTEMAFVCIGEIYFIKEKFNGAIEAFKRAIKISPQSSRAILAMAWAQIKEKKTLDALESFKLACKLNRGVAVDLRRAYKILNEEKSPHARLFAEHAQRCQ